MRHLSSLPLTRSTRVRKRRWNVCAGAGGRTGGGRLRGSVSLALGATFDTSRMDRPRRAHRVDAVRERDERELEVLGAVEEALHALNPLVVARDAVKRDGVEVERWPYDKTRSILYAALTPSRPAAGGRVEEGVDLRAELDGGAE